MDEIRSLSISREDVEKMVYHRVELFYRCLTKPAFANRGNSITRISLKPARIELTLGREDKM